MTDSKELAKLRQDGAEAARDLVAALVATIATGGVLAPALAAVGAKHVGRLLWRHIVSNPDDVDACCVQLGAEMIARLESAGGDQQAAADAAEEFLADPERNRILRTGLGDMLDVTTSRAWPCIAALVADYWAEGRAVDAFFKDATGFMSECVGEDLDAIAVVLAHGKQLMDNHPKLRGPLTLNYNDGPRRDLTVVYPQELERKENWIPIAPPPGRGMQLLQAYRFGVYRHEQIEINHRMAECWRLLSYLALRQPAASTPALAAGD